MANRKFTGEYKKAIMYFKGEVLDFFETGSYNLIFKIMKDHIFISNIPENEYKYIRLEIFSKYKDKEPSEMYELVGGHWKLNDTLF